MDRQEHIHIISAGERIHAAYTAAFRDHPTITRTYVFSDSTIYEISKDPNTEKARLDVRSAVSLVKDTSATLAIPFSRLLVYPPAYPSVRDAMMKIHREFPGANFTFDLSEGSKPLCMALFAVSCWLSVEVYSSFDEKAVRHIPLLGLPTGSLLANPNYQTILAVLLRNSKKEVKKISPAWVARDYLYKQVWALYVPTRRKGAKEKPPAVTTVKTSRGRKPAADLTHGTFSDFMGVLVTARLVEVAASPANKREKMYRITEKGETAFRFCADPGTNTLVRSMLEGT
jgi:hypothetical protein